MMASISLPVLTLWMRTRVSGAVGCDHPGLDRERPDAGQHIAAIWGGVDRGLLYPGLGEEVVDVDSVAGRAADNGNFGGLRMTAPDPVDLQLMPASHDAR